MRAPRFGALAIAATLAAAALAAPAAAVVPGPVPAPPAPAFSINSLAVPTYFEPGGKGSYEVRVLNIGAQAADGTPLTIHDTLPAGLIVEKVELPLRANNVEEDFGSTHCVTGTSGASQTVTCTIPSTLPESKPAELAPGEARRMVIHVQVPGGLEGPLVNQVEVQGGGALPAAATGHNRASNEDAPSGFQEFSASFTGPDGKPVGEAGSHPYQYTTSFAVNTAAGEPGTVAPFVPAQGDLKDIEVKLPPGLIGNPTALPRCTPQQFNTFRRTDFHPENNCPDSSAVGFVMVQQLEGVGGSVAAPLYNLVPPKGSPGQLGFQVASLPFYIDAVVRTGSDYGITGLLRNTTQVKRVTASSVTIWGVPADPSHDPLRGHCLNNSGDQTGPISLGECAAEDDAGTKAPLEPFWRLPTSCASPLVTEMNFNTWLTPQLRVSATSSSPAPTDCAALEFEPSFVARPTGTVADSPTGLAADLQIPQNRDPAALGSADVRRTVVTLPPGLVVNPSGANGLDACTPAQIGLTSAPGAVPVTFTPAAASCPEAAKIGKVVVRTPLLDTPLEGGVYAASPGQNPFGTLLAIYIAVDDPQTGVVVKLAGKVEPDPVTGQLTTTFDETPQQPFESFKLDFFAGSQAALRTPATCGTYATIAQLTPWSAPESGPPADRSDAYPIDQAPGGGPCATTPAGLPHAPTFQAGSTSSQGGAFSPLVINLRREDGSQEIGALTISPPPGLAAKLAGVPYCSEAALAAAAAKSGRAELASPSCPAASQVGSADVGAGAGPTPYYTRGLAYLAGPYKGAPLSLAIITPAVAGPYDVGTVVVRSALFVDPESGRVTAVSDPLPRILQGIPLDVRTIAVRIDRPGFSLNPTNCDPMETGGTAFSTLGASALLRDPFQASGCGSLGFRPKLNLRLFGGTKRSDNPKLRAVLKMPPGNANIAKASVALPHSIFLDQSHIRTICTRVQFAAKACPPGSIYGYARATSPLVDFPVEGPVYLRSSSNPLPDMVVALRGPAHQPVEVNAVARIDSFKGGIRSRFLAVPDLPIDKFVLTMRGGKRGLLDNSRNLCAHKSRASVSFDAHNGKARDFRPLLRVRCGKKDGRGKGPRRGRELLSVSPVFSAVTDRTAQCALARAR